jgi:ATP-dependent helicase/nuclease subunit A
MGLTEQQARAAYAPSSVAVTAGAGTGKTHMLAERYQYFLQPEQGFTPLELVAVTFTDKAATELRSRIRKTISDNLHDQPDLIAELEAAPICTFHALAARICQEHPEQAGVPADFTLMDDLDGKIWQAEMLAEALGELPGDLYAQVPFSLMSMAIGALLRDPLSAEEALSRGRADWLPIVQAAQQEALSELLADPLWQQARSILAGHSAPGDKLDTFRLDGLAAMEEIEQSHDLSDALAVIQGLKINVGSQKNWGGKEILNEVKDGIKGLRELAATAVKDGMVTLIPNEVDDQMEAMLPALRSAFVAVQAHLDRAKRLRRVLDYNDLEVCALKALAHADVREYYARRWKVFLIDEFQDTNPIQGRLMELLTEGAILTIVGDGKQSIYGFRQADVKVFEDWCEQIRQGGGESTELDLSFRTHDLLMQQVNQVFKPLLGKSHQALTGHRVNEPHSAPHLRVCLVDLEGVAPKPSIDDCRRVEAQHIADLVEKMLAEQTLVHDKQSGNLRPIQAGDIAILARTWGALEFYGQALAGREIPILQAGGGNLLETREAQDAVALLKFLANPRDDLALVAVLRSPFFAVSDLTLFQLAQALPEKISWWKHLKASKNEAVAHPIDCLSRLLLERRTEAPTRLLQMADRLTGYTAVIANLAGSARRLADWQGFIGLVRQLELGNHDVLTVVRRLQQLETYEIKVDRPGIEGGNAVSLLTVHGAKGLEWPVVIVPDLSRTAPNDVTAIRFDPKLGVALQFTDEEGEKQQSALGTLLKYRQKQASLEEAKRVLYVAMTRVRDQLIMTAASDSKSGLDLLLTGWTAPVEMIPFDVQRSLPVDACPSLVSTVPSSMLLQRMGAGLAEIPVTALTDYAVCPKRFEYCHVLGHQGYRVGAGSSGTEIGRLVHWAIEHNTSDVKTLAAVNVGLNADAVQEALALAQVFRESDIYADYRSGAIAWEHRVSLEVGGLRLNGAIDLLGSDFVLDFKTDAVMKPEHHRFQLWAYAEAANQSIAHIAYLRHDMVHSFDAQALAAIRSEAEGLVGAIQAGDFSPIASVEICGICPYSEICTSGIDSTTDT